MEALQNLLQPVTRMQWTDYLDILLVAFLIYRLLPLIRTPNTMRVAKAVVVVMVILGLAEVLHLYAMSFILNQFLSIGLIALVVLFQPELRRMLDHLGSVQLRGLLGGVKPVAEMDMVISQTVAACDCMSREKVGALIVFAREARLDDFIKTGTIIDGQVSEQLIRNIFFPKAALHDGAMIIREGRATAAGCVLPLSQSDRLSAETMITMASLLSLMPTPARCRVPRSAESRSLWDRGSTHPAAVARPSRMIMAPSWSAALGKKIFRINCSETRPSMVVPVFT